jgi:hypothetical protein
MGYNYGLCGVKPAANGLKYGTDRNTATLQHLPTYKICTNATGPALQALPEVNHSSSILVHILIPVV